MLGWLETLYPFLLAEVDIDERPGLRNQDAAPEVTIQKRQHGLADRDHSSLRPYRGEGVVSFLSRDVYTLVQEHLGTIDSLPIDAILYSLKETW